ncbi:S41 family peptidase [Fibrella aquatilis]|uniref:Tail specific protease domain-containing protein n=1 Tax=Fibrella aquatilis TaxID=2817059 RepID=A0A939GB23_9BACT|nr:S41 family peptidase [Fibrella aquatilis]MBO0933362.1 hypothetical protein [Fibrella aquatilis]
MTRFVIRGICYWLFGLLRLLNTEAAAQPLLTPPPNPLNHVYSVDQLRSDFALIRRALEEAHPGLYRYHPRDSVNRWFDAAAARIDRPMTELQFRRAIEPAVDHIGCGHTDLYASKAFTRFRKRNPLKPFPVDAIVLNNKLYVRENRSTDTTIRRGTEITKINGRAAQAVLERIYNYISSDGYNQTFKPFVINTGSFGSYYTLAFGADSVAHELTLRDSTGNTQTLSFRTRPDRIKPRLDSLDKRTIPAGKPKRKPATETKPDELRSFVFSDRDTTTAIMTITSFSGGGQRGFFKQSFHTLAQQKGIKNLIVDVRGNLGGNSGASINLVSYLVNKPFQAYTQVDAPVRQVSFNEHLGWKFWRFFLRNFFTRRTPEGTYRRTGETGIIKPVRRNGFRGRVFVLINGGTFSAAAIFASLAKHNAPDRVTVVGRESGGGEYGCNAFTSPYLTLPETGVQLRLPLYKIVLAIPGQDKGHGVMPDVPVTYTLPAVTAGQDLDVEAVYGLISAKAGR